MEWKNVEELPNLPQVMQGFLKLRRMSVIGSSSQRDRDMAHTHDEWSLVECFFVLAYFPKRDLSG